MSNAEGFIMNDYREEFRILREAKANKKLVLFVGSGVSIDSGMPSWSDAIRQITDKMSLEKDSPDRNLLVPQLYYNWRGKKEYVELMRSVFKFNEDLPVNDCHRNIIALNTQYIITTNYDNLLEKAANENFEMVQVIAQDKELPYKTVEREIIKMHGDFVHDNFVLKEADYQQYSKNFPMLEVYIKSLIASNVILFIGYSFSDPDVKQLFKWVRDVLEDDFQRAYLFQVDGTYDSHMSAYYKNIGINIMYASEIAGNESKDASDRLCSFLADINNLNKDDSYIDQMYMNCLKYSELNYIKLMHTPKLFPNISFYRIENSQLYLNIDNELSVIKAIFESKSDEISQRISSLFERSMVGRITLVDSHYNEKGMIEINRDAYNSLYKSPYAEAVVYFDYKRIKELIKINECYLSDNDPGKHLQQAYLSYVLCDYLKSYYYLNRSSDLFYKKKQYTWYFISEFNRQNVGKLIIRSFTISKQIKDRIQTEISAIDLDKIYDRIPSVSNVSKELIKDIYTYRMYYAEFQRIYMESNDAIKETKTKYFIKTNSSYESLRNIVRDSYNFELFNYIMLDQYIEKLETYRLYAKTIITSSRTSDIISKDSMFGEMDVSNVHAKNLEPFDILVILKYFQFDELKDFLNDYNPILISLSEAANDYLLTVCSNLSEYEVNDVDYYWKCLCLLSAINMDKKIVSAVLESLSKVLASNVDLMKHHRTITKLIYSINNQRLFSKGKNDLLEDIIDKLFQIKETNNPASISYLDNLIVYCLRIVFENNTSYYTDRLFEYSKKNDYLFLPTIYPYVDKKIKAQITRTLKKWQWKNSKDDVEIYVRMVVSGVINSDFDIENSVLCLAEKKMPQLMNVIPDPEEVILNNILTLYLQDKIINVDRVKLLLKKSKNEMIVWLSNIKGYDYSKFRIEWLLNCSQGLLISIANNNKAKEKISNKIKQAYLEGNITNKKIVELFFRFFV